MNLLSLGCSFGKGKPARGIAGRAFGLAVNGAGSVVFAADYGREAFGVNTGFEFLNQRAGGVDGTVSDRLILFAIDLNGQRQLRVARYRFNTVEIESEGFDQLIAAGNQLFDGEALHEGRPAAVGKASFEVSAGDFRDTQGIQRASDQVQAFQEAGT